MAEAGLPRDSLDLTNAVKHVKCEPRGKRRLHKTTAQREITGCHAWLEKELERVQHEVIVVLGSTALKSLLKDSIATLQAVLGTPFQHQGRWIIAV